LSTELKTIEFDLLNMLTSCSITLIKHVFNEDVYSIEDVRLGYLQISYDANQVSIDTIIEKLKSIGLDIAIDPEKKLNWRSTNLFMK
jgi:hypothetical protein